MNNRPQLKVGDTIRLRGTPIRYNKHYAVVELQTDRVLIVDNAGLRSAVFFSEVNIGWAIIPNPGDKIRVTYRGFPLTTTDHTVTQVSPDCFKTVDGFGYETTIPLSSFDYSWEVVSSVPTMRTHPIAKKVEIGSTCRRPYCASGFNEWAEPDEKGKARGERTHICYSCRQDNWDKWGDK